MAEIEKYIPRRLQRDIAPDAIFPGTGDRRFLPGDMIDALNLRYGGSERDGRIRNVKGNTIRAGFGLPPEENKVIGVINNHRDNSIIYWIWNSGGDHKVVEYFVETNSFQVLLEGSSLNLQQDKYIIGGTIDDACIGNDTVNPPFYIDLVRARAGGYTAPYSKYQLSLAITPPLHPPTMELATNPDLFANKISADTWQAAYRYIFNDNRKSVFSPLSRCVYVREDAEPFNNTNNTINVTGSVPLEITSIVKRVEVAIRKGNTGSYYIFATIESPGTSFTVPFTNYENQTAVSQEEQARLFNEIPSVTEALEIIKNRVFLPLNKNGFTIDESTFSLALSLSDFNYDSVHGGGGTYIGDVKDRFAKLGGIYNVGILFSDDYGRTSFVSGVKRISIADQEPDAGIGIIVKQKIQWTLSGVPPAGFNKYCIVISRNLNHETYFQCKGVVHRYAADVGVTDSTPSDNFYNTAGYTWNGRFYARWELAVGAGAPLPTFIQIPLNVPFAPQNAADGYYVKFKDTGMPQRVFRCEGMVGDFIVVSMPPDVKAYLTSTYPTNPSFEIEVFKQKDGIDTNFYETGPWYNIVAGAFTTTTDIIDGDTYILNVYPDDDADTITDQNAHVYTPMDGLVAQGSGDPQYPVQRNYLTGYRSWRAESPSGIFKSSVISVSATSVRHPPGESATESTVQISRVVASGVIDYAKASWSMGRIRITNDDAKEVDLYSIFGFSEPYVQNTFINGLNAFLAENKYPVSVERGRVRCLKRAGQVLVALHERETTTLYIGEGFIRQGRDFILAKTEGVVGDDRNLLGGFGTINPESVINIFDQLYWWDAYRGAVVRYTNAGLYPISKNGMESYFYQKSLRLFPYKDSVRVTTGVDYVHGEFIISFPDVYFAGELIEPGETFAFSIQEEVWRTRYSFIPERIASANNKLYTFKGDAMWEHHINDVCNNFYGIQYQREWRFASNAYPGRNKHFLNIHHDGELAADMTNLMHVPVRVYTKEGQESYIPLYEWEKENVSRGKWCAPVLRDINSPVESLDQNALNSGDEIVSNYLVVQISNDRTDESPCSEVNVIWEEDKFSV